LTPGYDVADQVVNVTTVKNSSGYFINIL